MERTAGISTNGHEQEGLTAPAGVSGALVRRVIAAPAVRPEAVARARARLASGMWCIPEDLAGRMLDWYRSGRH